ncbi:MAG: helix-turn-helix transcriptional regulator, partial [Pseudomonadota bacterium]|nr:helix-turn-helix transcriptional regulator [Pseudomonadota bacterium]
YWCPSAYGGLMLGMSQEALGEKLSLTFQKIQEYEKGTNQLSASHLYELAHALDMPVQYFLTAFQPKMRRGCT